MLYYHIFTDDKQFYFDTLKKIYIFIDCMNYRIYKDEPDKWTYSLIHYDNKKHIWDGYFISKDKADDIINEAQSGNRYHPITTLQDKVKLLLTCS